MPGAGHTIQNDSRNTSHGLGLGYGSDFIVAEDCINDANEQQESVKSRAQNYYQGKMRPAQRRQIQTL